MLLGEFLQSGRDSIMVSRQPLKLFKENERKNSVRSKPEVVRSEALPQRKKTFLSDHFKEHILERE